MRRMNGDGVDYAAILRHQGSAAPVPGCGALAGVGEGA
jgi:hypothetical protein